MQMTRNQPKTFQDRRIFLELNNITLAEQPSKLTWSGVYCSEAGTRGNGVPTLFS